MVKSVDCVFRVMEKAITVQANYNLEKGVIAGYESVMHLDIASIYNFYEENYRDGSYMNVTKLYNALFMYPDALVALNWNNVGVALIYKDKVRLYIVATGELKPHITVQDDIFFDEFKLFGIAKSKVHSFEVLQPLMYLAYKLDANDDVKVYTYTGCKKFHGEISDVSEPKFESESYMNMLNEERTDCVISLVNGKSALLIIRGVWISE